jgi:NDP-sugar pyrophosphorylase family protein
MPIHVAGYREKSWVAQGGLNEKIHGVILAAGLGKRLQPFSSQYLPKPMLPLVSDIVILETWLHKLVACGIDKISLNVSVLPQVITNYLGDGSQYLADLKFLHEKEPSGTLGGVCNMIKDKACETVVVVSGDIVSDCPPDFLRRMYELHHRMQAGATIVFVPVPWERRKDYGVALLDPITGDIEGGHVRQFFEKQPDAPSNLNNASIYMLDKALLDEVTPYLTRATHDVQEPFYDFGKHLFSALLGQLNYKKLARPRPFLGVIYPGKWFDIGKVRDYLECNSAVLRGELDFLPPLKRFAWGFLGHNTRINFAKVHITGPVAIGHNCVICDGCKLGPNVVIGDGWEIGKNCTITNSVLWKDYSYLHGNKERQESSNTRRMKDNLSMDTVLAADGIIWENLKNQAVSVQRNKLCVQDIDWEPTEKRA